ncbi:hypothetical protein DPMN_182330 [Dreissena polymorpha]|uniref:Uncharacterized protein n=1 Tax=Dreissena polymorpha TaxID=45954 RepID=A0A9D4I4H7_DREPO|nr:hypothetical protein DPMN_182330 [Dreissena polymorpha]
MPRPLATETIFELCLQDFTTAILEKNAPPPGGYVFQQTRIIFELIQDIIRKNVQTKFHEDWTINVTFMVLTSFQPTGTILKLFHDDRSINVASRVLTKFHYSHSKKNAPSPCGHFFKQPEPFSNSSRISLAQILWPNFMNIG